MYESILQALRSGDAAAAVVAARDAVTANPQDATAHRLLAAALRAAGDRDAAVASIERAIELAPDDADAHLVHAGLLLDERQIDEAQAALARTIGLDPNQFSAYIVQGQLAIARGDLDEAERVGKLAARIAPEHPHVAAILGTVALRRGDVDGALITLTRAIERVPDDYQVRLALGFAYLAKNKLAFAEQAFRPLLERGTDAPATRLLVARLISRQGRPAEAADVLAPLLEKSPSADLLRTAAMLEYEAGRRERARELAQRALQGAPGERAIVGPLVEMWHRGNMADEARAVLDDAIAAHPGQTMLWHARLVFETFGGEQARALIQRWQEVMPQAIAPLVAQWAVEDAAGAIDAADALALRIAELEPGHAAAELRVIDSLVRKDPAAAVLRVEQLVAKAPDPQAKRALRQLQGRVYDAAGLHEAAVTTWSELHAEVAEQRLPYPPVSSARSDWPERAVREEGTPTAHLLWGAPGSMVERVVGVLQANALPLCADRLGAKPPTDFLQRYPSIERLSESGAEADAEAMVADWRAQLPARGVKDEGVVDWLLWWDNAVLAALRPHVPEAALLIALRDPRDMLLDWLAFGSPVPYRLESPETGARWLAQVLGQVAYLHEQDLMAHHLVDVDQLMEGEAGPVPALSAILDRPLEMPARGMAQRTHFPAGHWRAYTGPLAEAFALLTPVAKRLGYAE